MMIISNIIISISSSNSSNSSSSSSSSRNSSEAMVVALNEYHVPGVGFSSLHKSYLIFTASLWDSYDYYPHLTGEKMEA